MSTSGKTTFVHIVCVFLFMLVLISGSAAYLFYNDYQKLSAETAVARQQVDKLKGAFRRSDDDIQALKKLLGKEYEQVGDLNTGQADTVIGATRLDIQRLVGPLPVENVENALAEMSTQLDAVKRDRAHLRDEMKRLQEKIVSLENLWGDRVQLHKQASQRANQQVQDLVVSKEEAVQSKMQRNQQLTQENQNLLRQIAAVEAERAEEIEQWQQEKVAMLSTIRMLRRQVNEFDELEFDQPDGVVRLIDHKQQVVWINLGSSDGLPSQMTFSVFGQNSGGFAVGRDNVKAKLQVLQVTGPHLSQARILEDDPDRPILKGDAVYTPLWSPGRTESFAFTGLVDPDNDGTSDFASVQSFLTSRGAQVAAYVDQNGVRHGKKINIDVRFLVIGRLPEVDEGRTPDERAAFVKLNEAASEMRIEAEQHGVRIISLTDFLNYIGYRNSGRVVRRGTSVRGGAAYASPTTGSTTSGVFKSERLGPKSSGDNDRDLFRRPPR